MESLVKMDIFFFISSVSTVVLTVLASILLFYLIKAGRSLSIISETLKEGLKGSEEFVVDLKERLEDNIVFRILFPPIKKRRRGIQKNNRNMNNQ